ncbi:MAG: Crp/Fnr family transcriptional regulator [Chloroflexota bacterium]
MTDTAALASQIDATWFGSGLPTASRDHLVGLAREYEAPARARLLREGDETKELSVLIEGRVALTEHVAGRGSVTLLTVEPGDIFGWSALTTPFRATSTVVSLAPVKVIAFDGARLRADVLSDCELASAIYPKLLEALSRRLQATRHQLLDLYGSEQTVPW